MKERVQIIEVDIRSGIQDAVNEENKFLEETDGEFLRDEFVSSPSGKAFIKVTYIPKEGKKVRLKE